ncbi:hypothetical protein ABKN59_005649 [Abortiporus biennis]
MIGSRRVCTTRSLLERYRPQQHTTTTNAPSSSSRHTQQHQQHQPPQYQHRQQSQGSQHPLVTRRRSNSQPSPPTAGIIGFGTSTTAGPSSSSSGTGIGTTAGYHHSRPTDIPTTSYPFAYLHQYSDTPSAQASSSSNPFHFSAFDLEEYYEDIVPEEAHSLRPPSSLSLGGPIDSDIFNNLLTMSSSTSTSTAESGSGGAGTSGGPTTAASQHHPHSHTHSHAPTSSFSPSFFPLSPIQSSASTQPIPLPGQLPQGHQSSNPNPLVTQTFLAYLQYIHLQNQLTQQPTSASTPSSTSPPSGFGSGGPPNTNPSSGFQSSSTVSGRTSSRAGGSGSSGGNQGAQGGAAAGGGGGAPAIPTAEMTEGELLAIAEDKRRRNTLASARFRIKKKQWTVNLERTITDLSGRVEELEREAAELRRENGWLKEIVMLKSKRFGGPAPVFNLEGNGSGNNSSSNSGRSSSKPSEEESPSNEKDKGKGRENPTG